MEILNLETPNLLLSITINFKESAFHSSCVVLNNTIGYENFTGQNRHNIQRVMKFLVKWIVDY